MVSYNTSSVIVLNRIIVLTKYFIFGYHESHLLIVGLVNIVKNVFDYQDVLMDIVKQVSSANAMKGMRV